MKEDCAQKTLFADEKKPAEKGFLPASPVVFRVPGTLHPQTAAAVLDQVRKSGKNTFFIRFSAAERKIMRRRKTIPVSAWAEKHRVLTMSSMPGPWRNEVTPYLTGIMDAAQFPSVRVISVCKCPQSGVTEAVHNFIGSAIDQDPGPALYTFPDKDTADENSRDRILPMIRSSRRLRGYMTGTRNDESLLRINLIHMPIYLSWASSPARLGNKPIKFAVADETDKYLRRGKSETGPIELLDKRLTTYRQVSKFFKISTPTTESGIIWRAISVESEVVFYYWARCPKCAHAQLMTDRRIKFLDHCRDPKIMRRKNLARYQCANCGMLWDDYLRDRAVSLGQWRAHGPDHPLSDPPGLEIFSYLSAHRPQNIGFHLPAWITRFNSLSYCAAAFLETLGRDLDKRKNYANQIQAMPYKQIVSEPVVSEYKSAITSLLPQTVPPAAVALTCGIDCQKIGFYFVVRAWAGDYTSWLIQYGRLASWDDVETLLFATSYPVEESGRKIRIARAAIDTGGGKFSTESMTEQAYWWIRKNGVGRGARCWGVKGASWPQANRIKISKPMDKTPAGKPIPGGLQILTLDTGKLKDAFFYRLSQAAAHAPEMCAWLHANTGDDYFSHITAEHKTENDKGVAEWVKKGSRRNDWLDCEIYAAAAADPEWPEGGIHLFSPPTDSGSGQIIAKSGAARKKARW